jgi:hypothetical protein
MISMTVENASPDAGENTETTIESDDNEVFVVEKKREPSPYEKKLRTENAQLKARNKAIEAEAAADRTARDAAVAERETIANAAKERLTTAELKAQAMKYNIVDADDLKLLDRSAVKYNENGDVTNAAEIIEDFRSKKPHLFSSQTSVAVNVPKPKEGTGSNVVDWTKLTPQQLKIERAKIGLKN